CLTYSPNIIKSYHSRLDKIVLKSTSTNQINSMKSSRQILIGGMLAVAAMAAAASVRAQIQTTGTPGSPGATTTISGKQLPAPDPKFGGVITNDALKSKPWWAPRIVPPKDAPNVLLIITDDSGFVVPSTFRGVSPTPAMHRRPKNGLRHNT